MPDLLGFQPQCSDIKLHGLHEEALYESLGSGTESRIQYRQRTQQDHKTKIILNSSTVFSILSLYLSSSITRRLSHSPANPPPSPAH
ncbi:MAG: hypothetical protein Q7T85_00980 [Nitrosomonas sp.]|nr:hypothetical protein [Nitrosomonas sp.]